HLRRRVARTHHAGNSVSSLESTVALVTGASRGIGRGIAVALARAGSLVVGTATSQAGADSFHQLLENAGWRGTGVVMNVNDAVQIEAVLQSIRQQYGDVAILVNNAGITRDNLLLRMKDADWDEILSTNLTSSYRLSKGDIRG